MYALGQCDLDLFGGFPLLPAARRGLLLDHANASAVAIEVDGGTAVGCCHTEGYCVGAAFFNVDEILDVVSVANAGKIDAAADIFANFSLRVGSFVIF